MKTLTLIATLTLLAAPAFAQGDAAKGEDTFKKCKSCHSIIAPDGVAVIKGGKIGPNLYGIVGRAVASVADFKYGEGLKSVGAKGVIWDEAMIATYVVNPTDWVKEQGGDGASKMAFKLPAGGEDVAAYLATFK